MRHAEVSEHQVKVARRREDAWRAVKCGSNAVAIKLFDKRVAQNEQNNIGEFGSQTGWHRIVGKTNCNDSASQKKKHTQQTIKTQYFI